MLIGRTHYRPHQERGGGTEEKRDCKPFRNASSGRGLRHLLCGIGRGMESLTKSQCKSEQLKQVFEPI